MVDNARTALPLAGTYDVMSRLSANPNRKEWSGILFDGCLSVGISTADYQQLLYVVDENSPSGE